MNKKNTQTKQKKNNKEKKKKKQHDKRKKIRKTEEEAEEGYYLPLQGQCLLPAGKEYMTTESPCEGPPYINACIVLQIIVF